MLQYNARVATDLLLTTEGTAVNRINEQPRFSMTPLSKSKLMAYRQCPKRLWLEVNQPALAGEPGSDQTKLQVGREVGAIARKLYDEPGLGHTVDAQAEGITAALTRSAELLATVQEPVFEAGFQADGALAFADVMLPKYEDGQVVWSMVEVKSSASIKDHHLDDLALQAHIATSAGVKLKSVAVAHLDNSWVHPGVDDHRGLLQEVDLTKETVARTNEIKQWIADAQAVAIQPGEPKRDIGSHCSVPFACGFHGYCSQGVPKPEYPVSYLPNLHPSKRAKLDAQGIVELRDVPDSMLNALQRRVKQHTLAGTTFFDNQGAAVDLAPHGFPAYFLDFESVQLTVPKWKGTRPFQQIVFQFSLHTLSETGQLDHVPFLDLSGNDPSEPFAHALVAVCGDSGPVFVYNATFEKTRIKELSHRFPDLAKPLRAINTRIVDLLPVAQNRYYHPSQGGSWSIKKVLPTAVPELSYDRLDGVKNGGDAMQVFHEAIHPETTSERKREIETQLLAYCRLDTFAMVRLWQFFRGGSEAPLSDA